MTPKHEWRKKRWLGLHQYQSLSRARPNLWFRSAQSLSPVRLFETPRSAARQASLSITNSWSLLKPISIESVMPSSHLMLCRPLLLLPSIFSSIRVFSTESTLHMRWPRYWSFSLSISPSNEHPGLISFRMDCLDLLGYPQTKFKVAKGEWGSRQRDKLKECGIKKKKKECGISSYKILPIK